MDNSYFGGEVEVHIDFIYQSKYRKLKLDSFGLCQGLMQVQCQKD